MSEYIGRFAPSPSGPLHFGSLVAALASYLDAKAHDGRWLIRIEDLDTPRCNPIYSRIILETLNMHCMTSDSTVLFQSERLEHYEQKIKQILNANDAYYCQLSRKQIKQQGGFYHNACRHQKLTSGAIRFINNHEIKQFEDRIKGPITVTDPHAFEDFILLRRDQIFAYNFAVVLDDIHQGITHIVRGEDLLTTTPVHLSLYHYFKAPIPRYAHIPLITDNMGIKLSKQNHAPGIDNHKAANNLSQAAKALGLEVNTEGLPCEQILKLATKAWRKKHMLGERSNIK